MPAGRFAPTRIITALPWLGGVGTTGKSAPRKLASRPNHELTIPAAWRVTLPGTSGSTNGSTKVWFSCGSKNGSGRRDKSRCAGRRARVSVRVELSDTVAQSRPLNGSLQSLV